MEKSFTLVAKTEEYSIFECDCAQGAILKTTMNPETKAGGTGSHCWPIIVSGGVHTYHIDPEPARFVGRGETWLAHGDVGIEGEYNSLIRAAPDTLWYSLITPADVEYDFVNLEVPEGQGVILEQGENLFVAEGILEGVPTLTVISKSSEGAVEIVVEEDALVCIFSKK